MVDKSTSQTLRRGLMVLDLFQERNVEYAVKELASQLNISSTVTFRLVNTLVECGYLTKNLSSGKYKLGFNAYKLGLYANPNFKLQQVSTPILERVAQETRETVSINVVDPITLKGICITSLESPNDIKFSTPVGLTRPLYRGASKKVILAFMEPSQQEQVFQRAISEGFKNIDDLKKDLEEIKKRGYAYSEGEVYQGAFNVSVPLFSSEGHILAGISITLPAFRVGEDTVSIFSKHLMRVASQIKVALEGNTI
jgi:DNA-binding IclR family transcriptional regulator